MGAAAVAEAERLAARGWDGEGLVVRGERVEGSELTGGERGAVLLKEERRVVGQQERS